MTKLYSIIERNVTKEDVSEALGTASLLISGTKDEQIRRLMRHTKSVPRATFDLFSPSAVMKMTSNCELGGKSKPERILRLIASFFPEELGPTDLPPLPDELEGLVDLPNVLIYQAFVRKYEVAVVDFYAN